MNSEEEKINQYIHPYHWAWSGFNKDKYGRSIDLLKPYLNEEMEVLDVGCGDACKTALMAPFVKKVIGIENQKKPLEFAEIILRDLPEGKKIELLHYDGKVLPFEKERFDLVTTFDVIEHLPVAEVKPWLESLKEVLKPNGLLVIVTPNPRELKGRFFGHKVADKHYKEYTPNELTQLTEDLGFSTVTTEGIYLPPPFPYVQHYANIFPLRSVFRLLIKGAKRFPHLSETVFLLVQKT